MTNKTHYRKVFKSDHLGTADLEDFIEAGSDLVFTIKHVRQEMNTRVAGRKINANIAYFNENIKPLVLNATNSTTLKNLTCSSFVEDWCNIPVTLYIDPTASLKGEVVGGVRIDKRPVQVKPTIQRGTKLWDRAISSYKNTGNFDLVMKSANILNEDMQFITNEVAAGNV